MDVCLDRLLRSDKGLNNDQSGIRCDRGGYVAQLTLYLAYSNYSKSQREQMFLNRLRVALETEVLENIQSRKTQVGSMAGSLTQRRDREAGLKRGGRSG